MYLLDASTLITPFHKGQLRALQRALSQQGANIATPEETCDWLIQWFERGFRLGQLCVTDAVYKEVTERKQDRPESRMLIGLHQNGKLPRLSHNDDSFSFLQRIHEFVQTHYEPHQAQTFLNKHDPELVALAKAYDCTLVAEEQHFIPQAQGDDGPI